MTTALPASCVDRRAHRTLGVLLAVALAAAPPIATAGGDWPCTPQDLGDIPVRTDVDFAGELQPIFSASCASSGCHGGPVCAGGLDLRAGQSYAALVDVASAVGPPGSRRVVPGDPRASVLFLKLNCTDLATLPNLLYGQRMPRIGPPLTAAQQARFFDWIAAGAPLAPGGGGVDGDLLLRSGFERNRVP